MKTYEDLFGPILKQLIPSPIYIQHHPRNHTLVGDEHTCLLWDMGEKIGDWIDKDHPVFFTRICRFAPKKITLW
jgi:hypothetical protein